MGSSFQDLALPGPMGTETQGRAWLSEHQVAEGVGGSEVRWWCTLFGICMAQGIEGAMLDVTALLWLCQRKERNGRNREREGRDRDSESLKEKDRHKEKHSAGCWHTDSQKKRKTLICTIC